MSKKITLQNLIARAEQSKKDKFKVKEIFIKSLDGNLVIKKINENIIFDILDRMEANKEMKNLLEGYDELIYHSCDLIKDKELIKICNVSEPTEIPKVLFSIAERTKIGEEILKLNGFNDMEDDIKN